MRRLASFPQRLVTEELQVVESDVSARATELTLKLMKARGSQVRDPIPLPQRLRLLGAAKRVERSLQ